MCVCGFFALARRRETQGVAARECVCVFSRAPTFVPFLLPRPPGGDRGAIRLLFSLLQVTCFRAHQSEWPPCPRQHCCHRDSHPGQVPSHDSPAPVPNGRKQGDHALRKCAREMCVCVGVLRRVIECVCVIVKKKRELFPGCPPMSRGSFVLPL